VWADREGQGVSGKFIGYFYVDLLGVKKNFPEEWEVEIGKGNVRI